jgi:menaquinone-dependent protoporphyrinogen oxidase
LERLGAQVFNGREREASMNVLIAFASTEGQTLKIINRISERMTKNGHSVTVHDSSSAYQVPNVENFDSVIAAASVYEGLHQASIVNFAIAHRDQLSRMRSAFISVSLSAAWEDGQAEARDYVDKFTVTTNWSPREVLLIGGALRYSECDYFQRQVVDAITRKHGVMPRDNGNYEFTDWNAVDSFADRFLVTT